ncbi:MAG TPA: ATPase, T2SS/T4P/T4SS family [Acidimicrobiales bacterium]
MTDQAVDPGVSSATELDRARAERAAERAGAVVEAAAPPTGGHLPIVVSGRNVGRFDSRPKLGRVLVDQGMVTEDEIEAALQTQRETGERIGRILVEEGIITSVQLTKALAEAAGVGFVDLDDILLDPSVARALPETFARRAKAVAIGTEGEKIVVAMVNPSDVFAVDDMRTVTKSQIRPVMADEGQILRALERVWRSGAEAEAMLQLASDEAEVDDVALPGGDHAAEDAPVVQFVNELLTRAVHDRASDIHLEPTGQHLRVRFRVDGVVRDVMTVPRQIQGAVVSRLKIMADINIAERRKPQDGRVTMSLDERAVDIRVVTLPTAFGEAVVMRLLDRSAAMRPVADLGFMPESLAAYQAAYTEPYGAILVTGPTGSGKSTTLYATLHELNDPARTIVTVEDPIEYRLAGIKQVQLNAKAGLTFASALRSILRADPDVVLVGEIRDEETARIAIEAALTGHKVLSSLHTNSAAATPTRLVEMGVEPYLVISSLGAVLAQRLVRQLCKCRVPFEPKQAELEAAGWPEGFRESELVPSFCRAHGCEHCGGTGYRGRFAVQEVMTMTPAIAHLVLEHASADDLAKQALAEGMISMRLDGLRKAAGGLTTIEEILRVVPRASH